jgi:hypothetical protein
MWNKQLKIWKIYFGSFLSSFSTPSVVSFILGQWWGRSSWWQEDVLHLMVNRKQRVKGQRQERDQGHNPYVLPLPAVSHLLNFQPHPIICYQLGKKHSTHEPLGHISLKFFLFYSCTLGTLQHWQKFLHYIIVDLTPSIILLFSLTPILV